MTALTGKGTERGILIGKGAAVAIAVLLVLLSVTATGIFGTRTKTVSDTSIVTSTATSTLVSTMPNYDSLAPIIAAFDNYLLNVQSGNSTALKEGYLKNATLHVQTRLPSNMNPISAADAQGVSGNYVGSTDASIFSKIWIASTFNQDHNMTMMVLSFNTKETASNAVEANSTIGLSGFGNAGRANGTVVMDMKYVQVDGVWLISGGTWTITNFLDHRVIVT
jgi:hypothetical protein